MIGFLFRLYRGNKQLSRNGLANEIGIQFTTVERLEEGDGGCNAHSLLKIMKWLFKGVR